MSKRVREGIQRIIKVITLDFEMSEKGEMGYK